MRKVLHLGVITACIAFVVVWLYPGASEMMHAVRTHSYPYPYTPPSDLYARDTSAMPPAVAVPILMYHGVIARGSIGPNTSRRRFIEHMEMLKREGYETVTVADYDRYRNGIFVLPPRPIIITFDDGRKDSYFTVDEVFRALDFKATMFVATIKANTNDPFYLSWNELKTAHASGRWEIEAHGRHSHDEVPSDSSGNTGTYLVTRIFSKDRGLESMEDYAARVEADYAAGAHDLKEHLGIDARYYAIPLNRYGKLDLSNFDGAYDFNVDVTKKYFRLAFAEVLATEQALESFFNFPNTDPYNVRRLEVKNMTVEDLRISLEKFMPLQ